MEEIWNDIEGWEGVYQVSNLGRVKSLDRYVNGRINGRKSYIKGCFLTPVCGYDRRKKYLYVNLCVNGKCKKYSIHQLVAKAFIPNQNNYSIINHKDENPSNNFVYINEDGTVDLEKSNLEWCTAKYNANYGTRNKRIAEKLKGENHPNYGKHHSEETKQKISEAKIKCLILKTDEQ